MNRAERASMVTAADLRRSFDRAFSERRDLHASPSDDFLAVRIGPDSYAIRLREIGGVFADKAITWLPTTLSGLLGAASFRGAMCPVYDLAVLFGYPPTESARWLVTAANDPVAFAVSGLDGHLRLQRDAVVPHGSGRNSAVHAKDMARAEDGVRPIVDLPSVIEAVKRQVRQDVRKER